MVDLVAAAAGVLWEETMVSRVLECHVAWESTYETT